MARRNEPAPEGTAPAKTRVRKSKSDQIQAKLARTLLEVGSTYREAAQALRSGDSDSYNQSLALIENYAGICAELGKKLSDAITAEGLAEVTE